VRPSSVSGVVAPQHAARAPSLTRLSPLPAVALVAFNAYQQQQAKGRVGTNSGAGRKKLA